MNIKSSDIKCYRDLAKILSVSPNNFVDVNLLDAVIRIFDMQLRNLIIENIQPDDDVDFNRFVATDNFEIDYSDEKIIGFILAGGLGSRLSSVENSTPKPLVEIAGKAMLKRVIEKINEANIEQVVVSVYNYKDKLKSYFDQELPDIEHVEEFTPLGTAGSLNILLEQHGEKFDTVLTSNADIISPLKFSKMLEWHFMNRADLTVGIVQVHNQIPFGVVSLDGVNLVRLKEKPIRHDWVCSGASIISRKCIEDYIGFNEQIDMPCLIERAIKDGKNVVSFPIYEAWADAGTPASLEYAKKIVEEELAVSDEDGW